MVKAKSLRETGVEGLGPQTGQRSAPQFIRGQSMPSIGHVNKKLPMSTRMRNSPHYLPFCTISLPSPPPPKELPGFVLLFNLRTTCTKFNSKALELAFPNRRDKASRKPGSCPQHPNHQPPSQRLRLHRASYPETCGGWRVFAQAGPSRNYARLSRSRRKAGKARHWPRSWEVEMREGDTGLGFLIPRTSQRKTNAFIHPTASLQGERYPHTPTEPPRARFPGGQP